METYPFLSDEWVEATRKLREAHTLPDPKLRLNLVVTGVPFGNGEVDAHLDADGIELGHLPKVDATITVAYDTAKSMIVDGQTSGAMEAMQLGRIKVKGNMFKLLGLSKLGKDAESQKLAAEIRAITS